jgi:hypothetical protein
MTKRTVRFGSSCCLGCNNNRGLISRAETSPSAAVWWHLWGLVGSEAEPKALCALEENVPGVLRVSNEMIPSY